MLHRLSKISLLLFVLLSVCTCFTSGAEEGQTGQVPPQLREEVLTYARSVQAEVKSHWFLDEGNKGRRVRVSFDISADGTLSNQAVVKSSGDDTFDASAMRALYKAKKLPPPPALSKYISPMHIVFDDTEGASTTSRNLNRPDGPEHFGSLIVFCVMLFIGITVMLKSTIIVKTGHAGIRERLGKYVDTLRPGLHLKLPLIDIITQVSLLSEEHILRDQTISDKDGKTGSVDLRMVTRIVNAERARYSVDDAKSRLTSAALNGVRDQVRNYSLRGLGIELG